MTGNRFRVVLDTNVILASYLTESQDSPNKEIIKRWKKKEFDVLWTVDILSEYINKLKNFDIPEEDIIEFISQFFVSGEEVEIKFYHYEFYPEDVKDICFVLCALNGKGTHIITYDPHLLDLQEDYRMNFEIQVLKPIPFLQQLREKLSRPEERG